MGSRLAGLHLISVVKSREERARNLPELEGWVFKNNNKKKRGFWVYYAQRVHGTL